MSSKTISPFFAASAVAVCVLVAAYTETNALATQERKERAGRTLTMAYCTSCHSSPAMLARMKAKEGPTHFLFRDGTPLPIQCRVGAHGPSALNGASAMSSAASQGSDWSTGSGTKY